MPLLKRRPRMEKEREQFKLLAATDLTYRQIGDALGVCPATIKTWRAEYNIPYRKRGTKPAAVTNGI